ncbi:Txe/YoeB family addiction module toxin [Schleiferilactobacillus perolens]|uniref:Txe/YoeB family addiction module toxin n=1 Tax=Schleiferilactobacillus perolens TaxID=100468 RepID=UPI000709D77B|nr:Txe/YoeB family addiction module toxin [Schleiferilactobacillus perolens]
MAWDVRIVAAAKYDVKRVLRSPYRDTYLSILSGLYRNPYEPTHSFEKLQPPAAGLYSKRITGEHRVVYSVDKDKRRVKILAAWTHYQ